MTEAVWQYRVTVRLGEHLPEATYSIGLNTAQTGVSALKGMESMAALPPQDIGNITFGE